MLSYDSTYPYDDHCSRLAVAAHSPDRCTRPALIAVMVVMVAIAYIIVCIGLMASSLLFGLFCLFGLKTLNISDCYLCSQINLILCFILCMHWSIDSVSASHTQLIARSITGSEHPTKRQTLKYLVLFSQCLVSQSVCQSH